LGAFVVDDEVRENVAVAAETFRALGADVEEVEVPLRADDLRAAARAHFATIFGGLIAQALPVHRELMTSYAIEFAEDSARPNVGYYRSLEIESEVYAAIAGVLEDHRILMAPAFGLPALKATVEEYDPETLYVHGLTLPFNMCSRCPVLVVPCGRSRDGLPLGVQLVGRTYDDLSVFAAATAFERAHHWYETDADRPDRPRRTT